VAEEHYLKEHYLFCKELPKQTTGEEIFIVINEYFETKNISWMNCVSLCTDGAAAMTGRVSGLASKVQSKNSNIQFIHCFIHREALMAKTLPPILMPTLNDIVKMVNFIKSKPLQSRLFSALCEEMESEHQSLIFHTEVRWLSKGKVLARVHELKEELKLFLRMTHIIHIF
jgi:zinc finger BED domain-containing protein 5/7/8/9